MIRRLLVLAGLLVVAMGATPAYAQYGQTNFIRCTPTTAAPGTTVTCEAGYFDAGTTVTWTLNSTPVALGSTTVTGSGTASVVFQVPPGFAAGAHTVSATGVFQGATNEVTTLAAAITVTAAAGAAATPRSTGALPVTGSGHLGLYSGAAAVLVASGGLLLMANRKRRLVSSDR